MMILPSLLVSWRTRPKNSIFFSFWRYKDKCCDILLGHSMRNVLHIIGAPYVNELTRITCLCLLLKHQAWMRFIPYYSTLTCTEQVYLLRGTSSVLANYICMQMCLIINQIRSNAHQCALHYYSITRLYLWITVNIRRGLHRNRGMYVIYVKSG